jgi:hypothetical protein
VKKIASALHKINIARQTIRGVLLKGAGHKIIENYYKGALIRIAQYEKESFDAVDVELDVVIKYYKNMLNKIAAWEVRDEQLKKTASKQGIWDIRSSEVINLHKDLEVDYKKAWKELSNIKKVPMSLEEKQQKGQELKELEEEIDIKLQNIKKKAEGLYNTSANFDIEEYHARQKLIDQLEKLKDLNMDKLTYQWIINI